MGNCCSDRTKESPDDLMQDDVELITEEEDKKEIIPLPLNATDISIPTPVTLKEINSVVTSIPSSNPKSEKTDEEEEDDQENVSIKPKEIEEPQKVQDTSSTKKTEISTKEKEKIIEVITPPPQQHQILFLEIDNKSYSLNIEITSLQIKYNSLYKLGINFNPFIEISINDTTYYTINPIDSVLKNDNISNNLDHSMSAMSAMSDISENTSELNLSRNSNSCSKSKHYFFDFKGEIPLDSSSYFSFVNIIVKNKLIKYENINKYSNKLSKPNEIVIGRVKYQICNHNLYMNKNSFEVYYLEEAIIGKMEMNIKLIEENDNIDTINHCFDYLTQEEFSALNNNKNDYSYQPINFDINSVPSPEVVKGELDNSLSCSNLLILYQILFVFCSLSQSSFVFINSFLDLFQSKEEFLAFFQNIINQSSSSISTLNLISSFLYNNLKKNRPNEKMNEKFYLKMSLKIMKLLYENPKSLTKKNKERDTLVKIFLIINELLSLPTKEKTESEVEFSKKKAHLNRKVIIPLSKELLLNENRVKIIKISNKLFEDTEIVCLASKILRKAFLSVLTDKYLSKKEKESFEQFTFELKGFLLKEAPFSKYLSVLLNKYQHYPELILNALAIVYNLTFTTQENAKNVVQFSNDFALSIFKESFNIDRGLLKGDYKQINKFHLGILANILECCNERDNFDLITVILEDLLSFYTINENSRKRYQDFIKRKQKAIEIHEKILFIFSNLIEMKSKSEFIFKNVFLSENSKFLEDFVDFISKLNKNFIAYSGNLFVVCCLIYDSLKIIKNIFENVNQTQIDKVSEIMMEKSQTDFEGIVKSINEIKEQIIHVKPSMKDGKEIQKINNFIQDIKMILGDEEDSDEIQKKDEDNSKEVIEEQENKDNKVDEEEKEEDNNDDNEN